MGPQLHGPLMGRVVGEALGHTGQGQGALADLQDGNDLALVSCHCVPGTWHTWLDWMMFLPFWETGMINLGLGSLHYLSVKENLTYSSTGGSAVLSRIKPKPGLLVLKK